VKGSERALTRAIVVHHPDFLRARTRADERDLRGRDAGEAAGEFADDLVCELVRKFPDLRISGGAAINFADDRLA
jgi:hypothetical protein